MCVLDPHRKQQRISGASLFLQCLFFCLTWSLPSSPASGLSRRYSDRLSASLLCLDLHREERGNHKHVADTLVLQITRSSLLFAHGTVFHEVANLATDTAAAVIWSHLPLGENFRVEEILLKHMKSCFQCSLACPTQTAPADTDHQTGVDGREGFLRRAEHSSAINKGLHDEVGH